MNYERSQATFEELVRSGDRFRFGRNWASFLRRLDDQRLAVATNSLQTMLGVTSLTGQRFLDIGSGSGLFSLAARRLGAIVHSFDFDPDSVACTRTLKDKFFPGNVDWQVEQGSVLDADYLESLGHFDVTYAWGVLHHTGAMWTAMDHACRTVRPGGTLFIMIYRDEGLKSRIWWRIKKLSCSGIIGRAAVLAVFIPYYVIRGILEDVLRFRNPRRRYVEYKRQRGMSKYHDWIDWLGGFPYEFATAEKVRDFCASRGFTLRVRKGVEYVFTRRAA